MEFKDLKGKILVGVQELGDEIFFHIDDGSRYKQHHYQNCCESVSVEEIHGDFEDLLNTPILLAEEVSGDVPPVHRELSDCLARIRGEDPSRESETWTFYKLATIKGSVTIRWYGSSNGYYSESVSFEKV